MSEIQRWSTKIAFTHEYMMVDNGEGEYVFYADHASALRERDERIAALEAENAELVRKHNEQFKAAAQLAEVVVKLNAENARLSAPVTDAEWQQYAYEVKVVRSKDFATVMMLEYHQTNALIAARKGAAS